MFQPETEDMLPRMAPKPSSDIPSGATEGIIRPQVPEVSILFGQQDAKLHVFNNTSRQQENKNVPQQTYASWKKQMLPKVTYPVSANIDSQLQENIIMHDYNCAKTNLYPIRSNTNPTLNIATNANAFVGSNGNVGVASQVTYRRSLDSCNNVYQEIPTLHPQPQLGTLQPTLSHLRKKNSGEVLTICAGTQTDIISESPNNYLQHIQCESWSNLESKKDLEGVRQILDELKVEQQRMSKMLETILLNHYSKIPVTAGCRDIGVQVDCKQNDNPHINSDIGSYQEQPLPTNKFLQHLKPNANIVQTPKGKPMAQSTTYRPNSPQPLKQDFLDLASSPIYQQLASKPASIMPKSASDTSLAMNELALKYLPSEKLVELLKELNMACPLDTVATKANMPLDTVNNDKFEKGPSDISNASYKYLKKYRLLPEDQEVNGINNKNIEREMENGKDNQIQYNSPQYCIRNTPTNQKKKQGSPYAGCLPLSPLVGASSPPLQSIVPQHIVNLENIKHQPKFL